MSFFSKLFGNKKAKAKVQAESKDDQSLRLPIHRMRGVVLAYYNYSPELKSETEMMQMALKAFGGMNPDCFDRYSDLAPEPMTIQVVTATGNSQLEAYRSVINNGGDVFPQCSVFLQYATSPIEGRDVPLILLTYYETEVGGENVFTQITNMRPLIPV